MLEEVGLQVFWPRGAYYAMADISDLTAEDDASFALRLVREARVAAVPGSSFFSRREQGRRLLRFCFCKTDQTLDEAAGRLRKWAARGA